MRTKDMLLSPGMFLKNCSNASRPPAEAPMATMGKDLVRRLFSAPISSCAGGREAALSDVFDSGIFASLTVVRFLPLFFGVIHYLGLIFFKDFRAARIWHDNP